MFTLYSDAELQTLISQVKAAIPKVLAGQRVKIDNSEYERSTLDVLKAFATALAREVARRSGKAPRLVTVRTPSGHGPRRPF